MNRAFLSLFLTLPFLAVSGEPESKTIASVTIFVSTDCPIANNYAPEINRLYDDYSGKGITFRLVYPDPTTTEEKVRKHVADYALKLPTTVDREHSLVKRAGVTVTPEVAVFDSDENVVYRGRIDNLYADFGKRRRQVTERYLRDALNAILKGEKPALTKTSAIGCLIEVLK